MRASLVLCFIIMLLGAAGFSQSRALVFQSDFGLKDGAVAAMKGVAYGVSNELQMFDLTHDIPPYNIWEGAYRLDQSAPYWPPGTVFVSVVDPGVGSDRRSIVMKTRTGHYFVTPDNGTLTLIAQSLGVEAVRQIDEATNRRQNSQQSYTFHGRDVYAYTGARLASGIITFEQVGPLVTGDIIRLEIEKPLVEGSTIRGSIDILDIQYGNVWTNIGRDLFEKLKILPGDKIRVMILKKDKVVFDDWVIYGKTFGDVPVGKTIAYLNSLDKFSLGINQGNFAQRYSVGSGPGWMLRILIQGK